ncbi:hypothetical protein GCM10011572_45330 [Pseudoduganella buxea]|uniref:Uncharacterized protein n=1 Tax=Pseudoduganella buxea TaxID=1949069 RepID=A0ABQ1L3C0_9BURK|nr:hypothetical protein GCM10011572_45330 [Pseudoduganella buxea]
MGELQLNRRLDPRSAGAIDMYETELPPRLHEQHCPVPGRRRRSGAAADTARFLAVWRTPEPVMD